MAKNKKTIISIIIIIILLLLFLFMYKVIRSKKQISQGLNYAGEESLDTIPNLNSEDNTLIKINVELLSGTFKTDGKNSDSHKGKNISEIKDNPNFLSKDDKGEIEFEVCDENNKIVGSFIIKSGEEKSHYMFLKSGNKYRCTAKSNDFVGIYQYNIYCYTI